MTALYSVPKILREDRPDGSILLRSAEPLDDRPPTIIRAFTDWAATDPEHLLVAERDAEGAWVGASYGEAHEAARAIGQALLDLGLGPERPLMALSGNSVAHLVITLGALMAGVPIVPTSVAYSLQSKDYARIKEVAGEVRPGAVFAEDGVAFAEALAALPRTPTIIVRGDGDHTLAQLRETTAGRGVDDALSHITSESVAKVLFTSGSTGLPKGVVCTHGMWAANQQMMRQVWPFLADERPIIVDWLPWSHTFGGNHNVGMVLVNGGTLYIDGGRPVPGLFRQTVANLADHPPTIYFNVPAGYAQLVPELEGDPVFAQRFFSRLRLLFNAAAALPATLRQRLFEVAERTTGRRVPVTGSWGLTETAPAVTNAHFEFDDARNIGVPLPGAEVLLLPEGDAFEIRARGPMVTPGYLRRPDLTAEAFDDEGFYKTGDAVRFADPASAESGLVFAGRLAEDFKLSTGTFVRVGAVRTALISAVPVVADAVLTGENHDEVCALAWLNQAEVRRLLGREPRVVGDVVVDLELAAQVAAALKKHNDDAGSSARVERLLLMSVPADLDSGEITDKGYVNQRRVLTLREPLVRRLYEDPQHPSVIASQ